MSTLNQGTVSVVLPESVSLPTSAGHLSIDEVRRLLRARSGLGVTAAATADAMAKNPTRLVVPNLTAEALIASGENAEALSNVVTDLEALLVVLKQARLIANHEAHTALRRVIASVRAQEKFDPRLTDLVPTLVEYFAREGEEPKAEG